jgi:hypothetical protein
MLRQEELAFIKVICTLQLSPSILKGLMMAYWCLQGAAAPRMEVRLEPPTFIESARRQARNLRACKLGRRVFRDFPQL